MRARNQLFSFAFAFAFAPALLLACNLILQNDAPRRADAADGSAPRADAGTDPGRDAESDSGAPIEPGTPDAAPFDASAAPYRRLLFYGKAADGDGGTRQQAWSQTEIAPDAGWEMVDVDLGAGDLSKTSIFTDDRRLYFTNEAGLHASDLSNGLPGPITDLGALPDGSGHPCVGRTAQDRLWIGCAGGFRRIIQVTPAADGGAPSLDPVAMDATPIDSVGFFVQPTATGFFGYEAKGAGFEWVESDRSYRPLSRGILPGFEQDVCSALVNGVVYVIFPANPADPAGANPQYYGAPATADWGVLQPSFSPTFVGAPLRCAASGRALYLTGLDTVPGLLPRQAFAVSTILADGTLSTWSPLPPPPDLIGIGEPVGLVTTPLSPVTQ